MSVLSVPACVSFHILQQLAQLVSATTLLFDRIVLFSEPPSRLHLLLFISDDRQCLMCLSTTPITWRRSHSSQFPLHILLRCSFSEHLSPHLTSSNILLCAFSFVLLHALLANECTSRALIGVCVCLDEYTPLSSHTYLQYTYTYMHTHTHIHTHTYTHTVP